jgi:hypothetical protein
MQKDESQRARLSALGKLAAALAHCEFLCIIGTDSTRGEFVKNENRSTILSRNARFLWLAVLFLPPGLALLAYDLTPHEEIWHEILYSLLCLPLFGVWLLALLGCVLSFLIHRTIAKA